MSQTKNIDLENVFVFVSHQKWDLSLKKRSAWKNLVFCC